jgi:hypothetical protein
VLGGDRRGEAEGEQQGEAGGQAADRLGHPPTLGAKPGPVE